MSVDMKTIECGDSIRLRNGSILEVAYITHHYHDDYPWKLSYKTGDYDIYTLHGYANNIAVDDPTDIVAILKKDQAKPKFGIGDDVQVVIDDSVYYHCKVSSKPIIHNDQVFYDVTKKNGEIFRALETEIYSWEKEGEKKKDPIFRPEDLVWAKVGDDIYHGKISKGPFYYGNNPEYDLETANTTIRVLQKQIFRYEETAWPAKAASAVNPQHYKNSPSGIECIQVVEHMNFNRGNAIKYIWRAGDKDPSKEIEDLSKAKWYLEREIERLQKQKND